MCGILGVATTNSSLDVVRNLFDLFAEQQSRGINGAGICIADKSKLWRFRSYSPYRLFAVYNITFWNSIRSGDRVLVHHRYPTSTPNDPKFNHPIQNEDGTVMVIHNGVIGNDDKLHKELRKNHTFETEEKGKFTDSEVLVHLFEDERAKDGDVIAALKRVAERATGSFAFALVIAGDKNIYLVKHSNPIIISKDDDGNHYFSSELHKSSKLTKVCEVGASEIGVLTAAGYEKKVTFGSAPIDYTVDWNELDDNGYPQWKGKWSWR